MKAMVLDSNKIIHEMKKKKKIIELLNDIAEGRDVPKKIQYKSRIFEWNSDVVTYVWNYNGIKYNFFEYFNITNILNDYVEILEDKPEMTRKIEMTYSDRIIDNTEGVTKHIDTNLKDRNIYIPRINWLIDKVNYLLEKRND